MVAVPLAASEPVESLTAQEQAFERWRKGIGLFLGPLVAVALFSLEMPALFPRAHTLAAVLAWTVIWWICEPIPLPVTALLASVLCVILGVADARTVFAPYADPIIYLFLGSFVLAESMAIHGLDKRFAYAVMSLRFVGDSSGRMLLAFGGICALLSMWISNTAATAMMFPMALGIVYALADIVARQRGRQVDPLRLRFGTGMMLMGAYAASVGGIGTPVGSPPNLIGIAMIERLCDVRITFLQWMTFTVPLLIAVFALLALLMYVLHKPEVARLEGAAAFVREQRERLGPWTRGQKDVLFCFAVTVCLWLVPGVLSLSYGEGSAIAKAYARAVPEGVAALVGAALLFVLPVDWGTREFTISWRQAARIDWGTLLLFGGGLTLGAMMFETRLAETIGTHLLRLSGATSVWGITLAAIYIAMMVSETSSNTASANMVIPVMIALAQAAGIDPVAPAIGATLGASWGFMLPVSTPPNAIVYGSGMVPITSMIRAGVLFDAIGGLVIWAGLYVTLPLAGLA